MGIQKEMKEKKEKKAAAAAAKKVPTEDIVAATKEVESSHGEGVAPDVAAAGSAPVAVETKKNKAIKAEATKPEATKPEATKPEAKKVKETSEQTAADPAGVKIKQEPGSPPIAAKGTGKKVKTPKKTSASKAKATKAAA